MKKQSLDKEELEIYESLENEQWQPVKNKNVWLKKFKAAALATTKKDQRMNIRIASKDLSSLKVRALELGLPYQTLVSSIIHKYLTGKFIEKLKFS